jgi:hypothetical protein
MARDAAIAAVGQALRATLEEARPARFGTVGVHLLMPRHFDNGYSFGNQTPNEGIGLLLYRVSAATAQRAMPQRVATDGTRLRPSLPLDLHYLLACWAPNAERQQLLLGWAMTLLADVAVLPASLLNPHAASADTFAAHEGVEITGDPLPLQDWLALWDKLKPHFAVGTTYVARGVMLESQRALDGAERVVTRRFQAGEVQA